MKDETHLIIKELSSIISENSFSRLKIKIYNIYNFVDSIIFTFFNSLNSKGSVCQYTINSELTNLHAQLISLTTVVLDDSNDELHETIALDFFKNLKYVYNLLLIDGENILNEDPAAKNIQEVVIAYPGFLAMCYYRIAHLLNSLEIPLIPRVITEYCHQKTGIDIHPGAIIGEGFVIDHGTGIVIGESAEIGNNVKIYQGVTLGALSVKKELQSKKRHPTIEDNVIIYANATILGGKTVIGKNSIIGGNAWIVDSIPPDSKIYTQPS